MGTLCEFGLRSLNGRALESWLDGANDFKTGMRLAKGRSSTDFDDGGVLPGSDGREPAGECSEFGCEIQSSDRESSQALSIAGCCCLIPMLL